MMASLSADEAVPAPASERILVVIPCLNEARTIESVVRFAVADLEGQGAVVVVDGQSTDGTPDIVRRLGEEFDNVHLLPNPRRVQSAAVNLAIQEFGDDYEAFVRLDAHAEYPAHFIRGVTRAARDKGCDSVVVPMITKGRGCFQRAAAAAQNSIFGNGGSAHRRPPKESIWVEHGHHAYMRVDAFRRVQGYDETFTHNEDAELDRRLVRSGSRIWLAAEWAMTYFPRASARRLWAQYWGYGKGRARTMLKHKTRPGLRQLAPAMLVPILLVAPLPLPLAWLPAAAWLAGCAVFSLASAIKGRQLCLLLAGLALFVMHLSWSAGLWTALIRHGLSRRNGPNQPVADRLF